MGGFFRGVEDFFDPPPKPSKFMEGLFSVQGGVDECVELDGGSVAAHASGAGVITQQYPSTEGAGALDSSASSPTSRSACALSRVEAQLDDNANNPEMGLAGAGQVAAMPAAMVPSTSASASGPTNASVGKLTSASEADGLVTTLALRSAAVSMFLRGEGATKVPGELPAAEQLTAGLCAGCVAAIGPLWSGPGNRRAEIKANLVQIDEMELIGMLVGAALGHAPLEIDRRKFGRETQRVGKAAVPAAREARKNARRRHAAASDKDQAGDKAWGDVMAAVVTTLPLPEASRRLRKRPRADVPPTPSSPGAASMPLPPAVSDTAVASRTRAGFEAAIAAEPLGYWAAQLATQRAQTGELQKRVRQEDFEEGWQTGWAAAAGALEPELDAAAARAEAAELALAAARRQVHRWARLYSLVYTD